MPVDFAFSAMAKRSDRSPASWRRPFNRWLEGVESGWSVPLLLACFVGIWTVYLSVAYHGAGLHPDVLETWTYGRHFAWGYPKHPPLMGWTTGAWTSVFPLTDWSLQLMAMTNAALALWFVDLIARRFVTGHKRLIVLLLLMLTPAYQFHAQRFNANAVLLAVWPLATYCFLRAVETRAPLWAIAAGVTASLAMLGKYYSIFLIASFALSAIIHPLRRAYFTSSSPWISAAVGLIVLSPHLHWLATTGAEPVHYAATHVGADFPHSLRDAVNFLLGLAAATSVSAVTWAMIAGYRIKRLPRDLAAADPNLKLIGHVAIGTIALPFITSIFLGTDLPSLWALQGLFLLAVPVVGSTRYRIERFYTVNAALLVAGIAIVAAVLAAPAHALYRNSYGYEEGRNVYHQAADKLTRLWHEQMGTPLSIVGGNDSLGVAVAFYSSDHPYYGDPYAYQYSLALPREVTPVRGWAALCFDDQDDCLEWTGRMAAHAGSYVKREFSVQSSLFGIPGIKRNLVAFLVAPLREPHDSPPSLVNDAGQGGGRVSPQADPPLRAEPDVALPENQPPENAPQTNDPGANMLVDQRAARLFVVLR
ncbi:MULTISPECIES: glycosyltransferase family 39 protein [unclassified Bradyrhizobium]|uniref:glycosyltransferase family 39 protein n=1 Tax=unclassified Bradyrhizobium TaxID=2631580 RepID=UPI001BAD1877|nr:MULTISPECIES: glycosyltransferase family 39 protein [unclassified Bradyrhizobium]MBR1202742.1 glycosyltransferase family 39 protein [Bradyrhizobium sp. AUGA SZCCT0124]MBR1314156.1 glycosyltransferase family 39 protein [Bradyrhizobium sp. AUGA SZCCT0051]MBR1342826.1 glycosyltransferase family 39 protein [Bradyrhizobium sp. AUGA SZCCT0105]MBR1353055.1 glycosyltransferase family 39 protein [Bradyrhizobium sp. AUGA SZCCT0045]